MELQGALTILQILFCLSLRGDINLALQDRHRVIMPLRHLGYAVEKFLLSICQHLIPEALILQSLLSLTFFLRQFTLLAT